MQRKAKKQSKPEDDIEKAERLRAKVQMYIIMFIRMYICTYTFMYDDRAAKRKATHAYVCMLITHSTMRLCDHVL